MNTKFKAIVKELTDTYRNYNSIGELKICYGDKYCAVADRYMHNGTEYLQLLKGSLIRSSDIKTKFGEQNIKNTTIVTINSEGFRLVTENITGKIGQVHRFVTNQTSPSRFFWNKNFMGKDDSIEVTDRCKLADKALDANQAECLSEEGYNKIVEQALERLKEEQTIKSTLQPSVELAVKPSILDKEIFDKGIDRLNKLGSLVLNGPAGSGKTYLSKVLASYITGKDISFTSNMTSYTENILFLNTNDNVNYILDNTTQHGVNVIDFLSRQTEGKRVIILNEINKSLNNILGAIHSATECGNKFISLWGKELTLTDGTKLVIQKHTYIIMVYTQTSAAKPDAQVTDRFGDVIETKAIGQWTDTYKNEVLKLIACSSEQDKNSTYNYISKIIEFAQLLETEKITSNINVRKLIDYANNIIDCPFNKEEIDRRLANKSWISNETKKRIYKIAELGRVYYEAIK